jgi:putative transposase
MNLIYRTFALSKQSFHQRLDRQLISLQETEQLVVLVKQVRADHPRMSSRQMYRLLRPIHMGRDKFEAFCFENGFKVEIKKSFQRTTNSLGVTRFNNLLIGFELIGINQGWVSDITYYRIGEKFYYLTFILDLYSRVIVGYSVSENLLTSSTTIPALQLALKQRKIEPGLIFHSDGGGQYYCKEWLHITSKYQIKNSMCSDVYENPYAERINGIIKNDYLVCYGPQNYEELVMMTAKAVLKYNTEKPHGSLGNVCPIEYERMLKAA